MQFTIKLLSESDITYQQIADLQHAAFEERLNQGLRFTCSVMTAEQFEAKMNDGYVFLALNEDSNELLGTVTIHLYTDKSSDLYGYHEFLAVSPLAKHSGVGISLAQAWQKLLLEKGAKYVLSDTACGAISSVKWHLKNGFKIIGLESYRSTNYWSYVFRRQLIPSKKWDNPLYCKWQYIKSWLFIKITRDINGKDTAVGRLYKRLKGKEIV